MMKQLASLIILALASTANAGGFRKSQKGPQALYEHLKLPKKLPYFNQDQTLSCVPFEGLSVCAGDEVKLSTTGLNGFVNAYIPSTIGNQRILASPVNSSTFTIFPWVEPPQPYNLSALPWNTLPQWILKDMEHSGYFHFLLSHNGLWVDSDELLSNGKTTFSTMKITGNQRKDAAPPSSGVFIWVNSGLLTGGGYIVNQDGQVFWAGTAKRSQVDWLLFDTPGQPGPFPGCETQTIWKMRIFGSPFDKVIDTFVDTPHAIDNMIMDDLVLNEVLVTNNDIYAQYVSNDITGSFTRVVSSSLRTSQYVSEKMNNGLPVPLVTFDGFSVYTRGTQELGLTEKSLVTTRTLHRAMLHVKVPGKSCLKGQLMVTKLSLDFPVAVKVERTLAPKHVKAYYNITGTIHSESASNSRGCIGEPFPIGGKPVRNESIMCGSFWDSAI